MAPIPRIGALLHGVLMAAAIMVGSRISYADHGGCGGKTSQFSPSPTVSVYEPNQRAIILWNGKEEILSLSTDIGHTDESTMTEFSPFPALPTAKVGDLRIFTSLAALAAEQGVDLQDVPAKQPHGSLSLLMTGSVSAVREFFGSANDRLSVRPHALSEGPKICARIANYFSNRGYHFFAFDEISVSSEIQSYPPIEYRFESNKIYYPLEVSTGNYGITTVDLVLITKTPITHYSSTDYPIQRKGQFLMPSQDLVRLSADWPAFMGDGPVYVQHVQIVGDIQRMHRDFAAYPEAPPSTRGPASEPVERSAPAKAEPTSVILKAPVECLACARVPKPAHRPRTQRRVWHVPPVRAVHFQDKVPASRSAHFDPSMFSPPVLRPIALIN